MSAAKNEVAKTLRVSKSMDDRFRLLSKMLRRPVNKLMVEALDGFLDRKLSETEAQATSLAELARAARTNDPDGQKAIASFIEGEMAIEDDPAEGRLLLDSEARPKKPKRLGPDDLFGRS